MLLFENRQLKKELILADKKLLDQREEFDKGGETLRKHAEKITGLEQKLTQAKKDAAKTAKLVRDQTGADLLVNALKELGVIPLGEKEPDHFQEAARLQSQAAAMRNQTNPYGNSLLGGLLGDAQKL